MSDPTGASDGSGAGSESGAPGDAHAYGADEARAYVPPQVVKPKPAQPAEPPKVQIKEGLNRRQAKTVPSVAGTGTAPAQAVPPEVLAQYGATPFDQPTADGAPPVVDDALPFRPAGAQPVPAQPPAPVQPAAVRPSAPPQARGARPSRRMARWSTPS